MFFEMEWKYDNDPTWKPKCGYNYLFLLDIVGETHLNIVKSNVLEMTGYGYDEGLGAHIAALEFLEVKSSKWWPKSELKCENDP